MSIILKHIWRNIKSNRLRSVLVILSLTLSAAVFYLNLNVEQDVNESTAILMQAPSRGYDVAILGNLDTDTLALPACEKTLEMELALGQCGTHTVFLYRGDCNRILDEGLLTLNDASEELLPLRDGQALMPRTRALYFGIAPGDTFTVQTLMGTETLTLAAYVESAGAFAADGTEYGEIFICSSTIQTNLLCAALEDESEMTALVERLQNDSDILLAKTLYDANAVYGHMSSVRQLLGIILLLVVAITFFVVSSTVSLIINYRIPVLGTFRSVGAAARQTNSLLLAESVVYGLVAGIPGVLCGELLRTFIRAQFLGISAGNVRLPLLLSVPIFTVLMNVAVSLFAVVRTGKTPVKDLIFHKQSAATKPSLIWSCVGLCMLAASVIIALFNHKYVFGLLIAELVLAVTGAGLSIGMVCALFSRLFGRLALKLKRSAGPVWLGLRNLAVNRINRSTSLLVCVVIALVMLIYVCVSSISVFFAGYENNYPYDILIKLATQTEDHYRYLEKIDGVDSVVYEYWDITDCFINEEACHVNFVAADGYSNGIDVDPVLASTLEDGQVIVDYLFAKLYHYTIGDTLVMTNVGNETAYSSSPFTATVVGYCDSSVFYSNRTTIMMTRNDFYQHVETTPAIIGISISTSRDVYEMIDDINDATAAHDGTLYRVSAKQDYVNDEVTEAMSAVNSISVVPFFTILLALCGLVNNQLISFNQKRMTYAVLNSTCMSRQQLKTMLVTELVASFAVGCTTGLLLSLWLCKIMHDVIFVTIAYVDIVVTMEQIGLSLALLLVLLSATIVFPLRRLKKMSIMKEIKYE